MDVNNINNIVVPDVCQCYVRGGARELVPLMMRLQGDAAHAERGQGEPEREEARYVHIQYISEYSMAVSNFPSPSK